MMTASWGRLTIAGHSMDSGVMTPHGFGRDHRRRSTHDHDDVTSFSSDLCWKVDSARSTPSYRVSTPSTSFRLYDERVKDNDHPTRAAWVRATPPDSKRDHDARHSPRRVQPPSLRGTASPGSKRDLGARDSPSRVQPTSLRGTVGYPAYTHNQLVNSIRLRPEEQRELHSKLKSLRVRAISHKGIDADGSINDHPRVIHYSGKGAKQDSWTRTGRKTLEVIQYNFSRESDGCTFTVMWDYQIGLIRIRPFFAAIEGHEKKTKPLFAIRQNPGLQELSYNITGGSINAQGYWMPFSCARALCAKFCYEIRWALTPVFGASFIRDCHPSFEDYKIENQIIVNATIALDTWVQGPDLTSASSASSTASSCTSGSYNGDDGQADDEYSETLEDSYLAHGGVPPRTKFHKAHSSTEVSFYSGAPCTPLSRPRRRHDAGSSAARHSPTPTIRRVDSEMRDVQPLALPSGKRKASELLEHSRAKRPSTRDIDEEAARLLGALSHAASDTDVDTEIDE